MTLPDQRFRSLVETKKFLLDLCDSKLTSRVPLNIRKRAYNCLKHWPSDFHLDLLPDALPKHFAKELEPLYKMVLQFDQQKQSEE